jgi:integrase/recombinase XerC
MVASLGNSTLELRDKAMLLLFFGSGLRADELAALKVEDIDLDGEIVKIWDGKGGKDARLPLSYLSIQAIKHYLHESRPNLAEFGIRSRGYVASQYLFLGQRCGSRMTRQQVYYRVRDIAKAVLGKSATPINLRHGYATALTEGGADLRDVQVLMRHAYISTTERYVHTDINYIKRFYANHPRASASNRDATIPDVVRGKEPQPEHDTRLSSGFGATHGHHRR